MKKITFGFQTFLILSTLVLSLVPILHAADKQPTSIPTAKPIEPGITDRAREFFDKGNQYAEKGLMDRAREYWKIAAGLDPRFPANGNSSNTSLSGQAEVSDTTFRTADPAKQKKITGLLSMALKADKENDFNSAI